MRATTGRRFFQGIPICDGLAVGELCVPTAHESLRQRGLLVVTSDGEWEKYNQAKARAIEQLETLRDQLKVKQSVPDESEGAEVLDCYTALINDELLVEKIKSFVFNDGLGATEAVGQAFKDVRDVLASMRDVHIQEKTFDIDACEDMLLTELCDTGMSALKDEAELKGKIVAVHQPHPHEIIHLHKAGVAGIISESGSKLSHAAILARSFNIPCVFGASGVIRAASKQSLVILDASAGQVSLNPSRSELRKAEARKAVSLMLQQKLKHGAQSIARTIDGHRILVFANAESSIDSRFYSSTGAEGIGLLRTEFLHLPHTADSSAARIVSEENLKTYFGTIAEVSSGRWVTIRLLDCGGDKPFPENSSLHEKTSLTEAGGVFGLRGIRFLLAEKDILRSQLRSIMRANSHGNLRVLIPFITDISEIRQVKNILGEIWETLPESERHSLHFPPIGAMIETPSATQILDFITNECDFVSIGSNDLTQHLLCVERDKPSHNGRQFTQFHPALLRSLKTIFEQQKVSSAAISICGELASEPIAIELLVGLGCRQLSARPTVIPLIKEIIRSVDIKEAQEFALSILAMDSASEIELCLKKRFEEKHGSSFSTPKTQHRAS